MQIQITDLLESYIENIEDTELAVLLSGGVDSLSVAFAADRVGKRISTYSFRLDIHDNYDNEKAQQAANEFGWPHRECVVDTTNLVEDFLVLAKEYRCKKKTHFECVYPFLYVYPHIEERSVLTGWGADGYYGVSKKAHMHYKEPKENENSIFYTEPSINYDSNYKPTKYISYYDKHWFYFLYLERQQEVKNAKLEQLKHIGNINDKVELALTITDVFSYKIHLENTFLPIFQTCYKFSDSDNNRFIYFGTIELGQKFDNIKIKATIKQHTTDKYNSLIKLTVLKRPKLINKELKDSRLC